jgi:hypothetical protein
MKTIVLLLIPLMVLLTPPGSFSQSIEQYTKTVVVSIPWGSEPGKVGFMEKVFGPIPGGPSSFTVDENNNIYILDAGNSRVQVFDQTGNLIKYFKIPDAYYNRSSIAFDDKNNELYINLFDHLNVYNLDGKLIRTIQCKDNKSWEITIDNGIVYTASFMMMLNEAEKLGAVGINGEDVYTVPVQKNETQMPRNKYTQASYTSTGGAILTISKNDKKTVLDWNMVPSGGTIIFMRDTVNKEAIYLTGRQGGPEVLIKFDENQKLIGLIVDDDINNYIYYVANWIQVTDDGTVYTESLNETGLKITKWTWNN